MTPQDQYTTSQNPPYPPAAASDPAGTDPAAGQTDGKADKKPAYTPLPPMSPAELQSQQLSDIAAGKLPAELGVKTPAGDPAQFPFLMYKKDGSTKAAKDEKEKGELAGKGYTEDPPKEDPNAATAAMLKALQDVWQKAGDALKTLVQLVEQQQQQMDAAKDALEQPPQQ